MTYDDAYLIFLRQFLIDSLIAAHGNQCQCAADIGVHRNTLQRLIKQCGLRNDVRGLRKLFPALPPIRNHSKHPRLEHFQ